MLERHPSSDVSNDEAIIPVPKKMKQFRSEQLISSKIPMMACKPRPKIKMLLEGLDLEDGTSPVQE